MKPLQGGCKSRLLLRHPFHDSFHPQRPFFSRVEATNLIPTRELVWGQTCVMSLFAWYQVHIYLKHLGAIYCLPGAFLANILPFGNQKLQSLQAIFWMGKSVVNGQHEGFSWISISKLKLQKASKDVQYPGEPKLPPPLQGGPRNLWAEGCVHWTPTFVEAKKSLHLLLCPRPQIRPRREWAWCVLVYWKGFGAMISGMSFGDFGQDTIGIHDWVS